MGEGGLRLTSSFLIQLGAWMVRSFTRKENIRDERGFLEEEEGEFRFELVEI